MGNPFSKSKGKKNRQSYSSGLSNPASENDSVSSSMQGRQRQGSASQKQKKKKNEGIRESKLAERLSQLEGFRHFVKLNVCSVTNTQPYSSSSSYTPGMNYSNTLTQGSMASGSSTGSVPFASPSFSTHSEVHQQWSASMMDAQMTGSRSTFAARLSHLEFDAICHNFDSAVASGLPGTWALSTLQDILGLSDSIALRLHSWIRLSTSAFPSATATQGLNDLIVNAPCLAFEEFFQWLIDSLYPSSPLSSMLSESVRNVQTISSQMTSNSFSSGGSIGRRLPWQSSSLSYGTGHSHRRYAMGSQAPPPLPNLVTSRPGSPAAEARIPYEFWFYLFASHTNELTRSTAHQGSRPRSQTNVVYDNDRLQQANESDHESYFHEIRSHYYLTKANFKNLLHWLLDLQFVQMNALPSTEPLADETAEELRACHRLVEGIVENSVENLYLSPIVTKLPLITDEESVASGSIHRSSSALSLFSDFVSNSKNLADTEGLPTVTVLHFYTWRDWMQRNLPRLFDVFPSFLRAKFLSIPPPPSIIVEQAVPSPSPSPLPGFKVHTKHASIVSLTAILPESKGPWESHSPAGSSFDRLRRVSESNMSGTHMAQTVAEAKTSSMPADPSYSSLILDTTLLWLLYHCLPEYSLPWRPQSSLSSENKSNDSTYSMLVPWELLYSTMRDGYSMTQFRHCCFDYPGSTLLLIQGECRNGSESSQSVVLGAVVSTPWKAAGTSWGNDECVIVLLYPVLEVLQVKHRAEAMRERKQTTPSSNLASLRGPYSNSLSKTTPMHPTYGRGYSSSMSPSFYMPPSKAATSATKPPSVSPIMHPVYCHVDHGIGFGGIFSAIGSGLAMKPDTQSFRLYIDAYFNTCTLSLHGQDDTYCASYLPLSTLAETTARTDKDGPKATPIMLPEPVKLDIAHMEVFGLAGPDALTKWSQSKAFDKRLTEQRQSINVKLKRRELESEKMLLNLVGIVSEFS